MKRQKRGETRPSSRPHELTQVLKILKTLAKGPKNTLAMYRELRNEAGFKNHHGFYRQLRQCLEYDLIGLQKVNKKWGIPTKIYHLTEKGKRFLLLFSEKIRFL